MTFAVATLLVSCVTQALITTSTTVVRLGFNVIFPSSFANSVASPDFCLDKKKKLLKQFSI